MTEKITRKEIDLGDLLFKQIMTRMIDDLVRTVAEIIAEYDEDKKLLEHEADIYDALSRGAAIKAEMARVLMKPQVEER